MKIGVISLSNPLNDPQRPREAAEHLLNTFPPALSPLRITPDKIPEVDLPVVLVESGGTEDQFRRIHPEIARFGLPVTLLATGSDNSLPAALEILHWLRQQADSSATLLHGNTEEIHRAVAFRGKLLEVRKKLRTIRLGILGNPSDWLIGSLVDYPRVTGKFGIGFVEFPLQQLANRISAVGDAQLDAAQSRIKDSWTKQGVGDGDIREALRIFVALREFLSENGLNAVTVRCFDLVHTLKRTGCLALGLLNQDGITAGCEGDVPAAVTMLMNQLLCEAPAFMANPSRIESDGITLAHCTVSPDLVEGVTLQTHFESGLGVALGGKFQTGQITISKLGGPALDNYYVAEGRVVPAPESHELCRTQVKVNIPEGYEYFLRNPLGNHHILSRGRHGTQFSELMRLFGVRPQPLT